MTRLPYYLCKIGSVRTAFSTCIKVNSHDTRGEFMIGENRQLVTNEPVEFEK